MKIIASGDSFIYGQELQDCNWPHTPSNKTFTALLAQYYDDDYVCVARPGHSNNAIARTVVNQCLTERDKMFVIASWTFTSRFEFPLDEPLEEPVAGKETPWFELNFNLDKDVRKNNPRFAKFTDEYLRYVGQHEYAQYYNTLKEIVYLQSFLRSYEIPYMFTSADSEICYQNLWRIRKYDDESGTLTKLLDIIDWNRWQLFPNRDKDWKYTDYPNGFWQWSKENDFSKGPQGHPLEQAHEEAYKILLPKYKELNKNAMDKKSRNAN